MREATKKAIEISKQFLEKGEPEIAAHVLRDLEDTEEKGLHDIVRSMCRDDAYVHENDVKWLIEELEKDNKERNLTGGTMKRVILSTKLLIGDGIFQASTISFEEAKEWVKENHHEIENFCGHETVKLLGYEPDRSRKTCDGYAQALCISAKKRLEFGREYSAEEIQNEIGIDFVLITKQFSSWQEMESYFRTA